MKTIFYFIIAAAIVPSSAYAQSCQDLYDANAEMESTRTNYYNFNYHFKMYELDYRLQRCLEIGSKSSDSEAAARGCQNDWDIEKSQLDNEEYQLSQAYHQALYAWQSIDLNLRRRGIHC